MRRRVVVMVWQAVLLLLIVGEVSCSRQSRAYKEFLPPVVRPQQEQVVVQARQPISLSCEGHRPVSWHTPAHQEKGPRLKISHSKNNRNKNKFISTISISTTVYKDTGSYICSFDGSSDLQAIDLNTAIHVYVYDEVHLLTHSGFDFQQSVQFQTATIPCTTTHPDVKVQLELEGRGPVAIDNKHISFSPRVGFLISPVLPEHGGYYNCKATYAGRSSEYGVSLNVLPETSYVPPPHINRTSGSHVTMGETLVLTCSVAVSWTVMVSLDWELPNEDARRPRLLLPEPVSRNVSIGGSFLKVVEQQLQLHRVDKEDQGNYVCIVRDHSGNQQLKREYIRVYKRDQSMLKVWQDGLSSLHKAGEKGDSVQWVVEILSHPPPRVSWYAPNGDPIADGENIQKRQLVKTSFDKTSRSMLKLSSLRLEDSGQYRIKVENDFDVNWMNFTLEVTDKPKVSVSVVEPAVMGLYQYGNQHTLKCTATGYPPPEITWTFRRCSDYDECETPNSGAVPAAVTKPMGSFKVESTVKLSGQQDSGVFSCMACGGGTCEKDNVNFFVTTLEQGFQISGPTKAIQGDRVDLLCEASKYNYTDSSLVWCKQTPRGCEEVKKSRSKKSRQPGGANEETNLIQVSKIKTSDFDVGKRLRFNRVAPEDSGVYICKAVKKGSRPRRRQQPSGEVHTVVQRTMELRVKRMVPPIFTDTMGMNLEPQYIKGESVEMRCFTEGIPQPSLKWFLNDVEIDAKDQTDFYVSHNGQALRVPSVTQRTAGEYSCLASSRAGDARLVQQVVLVEAPQILQTNLFALEQTEKEAAEKIVDPGSSVNLTCRARGTPTPKVMWTFGGTDLSEVNDLKFHLTENGQNLVLESVTSAQEGRYACSVENIGGREVRHRWLRLGEEGGLASLYGADIAIPVLIAVGVALVLALFLVLLARLCLSSCRTWKAPPTPPTPRLTQYEMPEDGLETESCRLTLSRDGSPYAQQTMSMSTGACHGCGGCQGTCHQCSACHYNYNGLYGCQGGSILGVRTCATPTLMSPSESQAMSEFPQYPHYAGIGTLPAHRIQDTLRREMSRKLKERRSASPRLSAEF